MNRIQRRLRFAPNRKCLQCGEPFHVFPSDTNGGRGEYCSIKCKGLASRKTVDDFWSLVKKTKKCWIWGGTLFTKTGYGDCRIGNRRISAHRLSYELANGKIPDGLCVCHHCDNRKCVRPSHLFVGSRGDNNRDAAKKGKSARGEQHGMSKLKESDVLDIRRRLRNGESGLKISAFYAVASTLISSIKNRHTWRHIA